jgi:hypothetical protein
MSDQRQLNLPAKVVDVDQGPHRKLRQVVIYGGEPTQKRSTGDLLSWKDVATYDWLAWQVDGSDLGARERSRNVSGLSGISLRMRRGTIVATMDFHGVALSRVLSFRA